MNRRTATEDDEDDEKKVKTKKEREKRKTSGTCVAKVIYTVACFTGFNDGRLKADIPAFKT